LNKQKESLLRLKETFGPIVTPDQLKQYKA
jgi:hypothetical protein